MKKPTPELLFTEEQIATRLAELGAEIGRFYGDREIAVVGLMTSCLIFLADLVRKIPLELTVHMVRARSKAEEAVGPSARGPLEILYTSNVPYAGRDILLLDDVIDTGITLSFILDHIRDKGPRTVRVCALVDKPGARKIDVKPDWAAFTLPEPMSDRYLVGYGLDHAESYRGLPYIGTIPRPLPAPEGRTIDISRGGAGEGT
jgi:hypoxanthine phosphoribosyltransferase